MSAAENCWRKTWRKFQEFDAQAERSQDLEVSFQVKRDGKSWFSFQKPGFGSAENP